MASYGCHTLMVKFLLCGKILILLPPGKTVFGALTDLNPDLNFQLAKSMFTIL